MALHSLQIALLLPPKWLLPLIEAANSQHAKDVIPLVLLFYLYVLE